MSEDISLTVTGGVVVVVVISCIAVATRGLNCLLVVLIFTGLYFSSNSVPGQDPIMLGAVQTQSK